MITASRGRILGKNDFAIMYIHQKEALRYSVHKVEAHKECSQFLLGFMTVHGRTGSTL